ncbi:molybdopterin synthase subunit MoaE [Stenotrophomonas maltophilia]|uniref:molybdenum cofactor biosynthesis protein MoaE n=1 Tax=Stenotrophomonas chelatiphaga TaxID=517011 RepID=UPI000F4CE5F1|nr:molybdenum cofactor biosynthesis protein MoaE [Stenotrophomonas chelatiphaga]MCS4229499.1 molybdopterin synthase catalytic subunit [Stenotrophomonas chelatiphaga]ROQ46052.1 molybdopterin synthase subunit MoaE [Stenotrophomonas maltophilia]
MPEQDQWMIVERAIAAIDAAEAIAFVSDPGFGGIDVFIGKVRDLNHGRAVQGITYDLFDPLVLAEFERLVAEVRAQFGPRVKLYVAHAKGRLAVGDTAVVVAAGTPHRDEAFKACRALIEAVKHRSPIWKQEHYLDGDSVWSEGCSLCHADDGARPAPPPPIP